MSQGFAHDYVVRATGDTDVWKHLTPQYGSGSADITFTIPSGVKTFKLIIEDTDTSTASDNILITLSDAGGEHTSGYYGGSHNFDSSTVGGNSGSANFILNRAVSTEGFSGVLEFTRFSDSDHKWMMSGIVGSSAANDEIITSGMVELDTEITNLTVKTTSTNTWQLVSGYNIMYENPDLALSGNGSVAAGITDVFINGTLVAATSGTEIDFEIPSGVKEFKISLDEVSMSTTNQSFYLQLGDAGGIEATGYVGTGTLASTAVSSTHYTTAFGIRSNAHLALVSGTWTFTLIDAATNLWACSGCGARTNTTPTTYITAGTKALSGELTTLRLTTANGTDTFDNGSVNIQYDNQELDLGSGVISGGVVQVVQVSDGEVATGTTLTPNDDTIPQSTEGTEFITASITPTNVGNKLKITGVIHLSNTAGNYITAALHQDSVADALCASVEHEVAGAVCAIPILFWMDAGTTSSTTFKIRAGGNAAGTMTFNGITSSRTRGGVLLSNLTITEYKA